MASTCTYIAEWFRHHLSSVVTFQKQFVDDVSEKVKEHKAQFDRHAREVRERAVRRHLDALEEKYLCCVCGRGGEMREDDDAVYDTYSMIELPPQAALEAAVREELADAEMTDERIKQHQLMLADRQRFHQQPSAAPTTTYDCNGGIHSSADAFVARTRGSSDSAMKQGQLRGVDVPSWRQREESDNQHHHDDQERRTTDIASDQNAPKLSSPDKRPARFAAARGGPMGIHKTDLAVMDPDMVGPLDVRNTLYKIQHAVLHKEARVRRKSSAVHKDKGLMMIEESEIDIFSNFFQRPLHGYLCMACYTCAGRRLDTLTQQIRTILFKAEHPVLRRLSAKELESLIVGNQFPASLAHSIVSAQQCWARLAEEQRIGLCGREGRMVPAQDPNSALETEERMSPMSEQNDAAFQMTTLPERCILLLRKEARCGACQRRPACYFEQKSVLFLCQFCTARDRFYREHAVCINDEPMNLVLARLLQDLSHYYEGVHQQKELRQAPLSVITEAHTDLFPLTEVMCEKEGLFSCQAPAAAANGNRQNCREVAQVEPILSAEAPAQGAGVSIVRPCTSVVSTHQVGGSAVPLQEQRKRVGRTMISLFDGVTVEEPALDLFNTTASASSAAAVPDLFQSAPVPPSPSPQSNGRPAEQAGKPAAENSLGYSASEAMPQHPTSTGRNKEDLQSEASGPSFTVPATQSAPDLPKTQNSDWESWF
ncbi:hypothetical protein JKF63_01202 [Porcisia hertigi]|uniref:Uncharacterized protein n=1 Tax=Porcisia hertigi TaxID=2761500 RepID=A0A836L9P7_9TRYP|nr:hypothetical protein JKF63_01202 [Porcisia hertigi]